MARQSKEQKYFVLLQSRYASIPGIFRAADLDAGLSSVFDSREAGCSDRISIFPDLDLGYYQIAVIVRAILTHACDYDYRAPFRIVHYGLAGFSPRQVHPS